MSIIKKNVFIGIVVFLVLGSIFSFVQNTEAVEATETEIFFDDFESSDNNWGLAQGWSIISEEGNHILQGTQHTFATAYTEGVVTKLELKLKLLQGSIHLNIRSQAIPEGLNRYFIGFNNNNSYISKQVGDNFQHLKNGEGISLNKWHNIKIEVTNNKINVFSDGKLAVWVQDDNLLQEGGISFETLDDSIAYIDNVRVETLVPEVRELKAQELFSNGEHKGDLTLEGRDFLVLKKGKFEQFGNIYLKDRSKLIIRDSTFKITRYQRLLNHWGIYLEGKASLEIENSKLTPGEDPVSREGTLFVIEAGGKSTVTMKNSPTQIHLFTISDNAKGVVEDSEIVFEIGGLVSAHGSGEVIVRNSKIGAVNLDIPNGATFEASGLKTGFFEKWNLHQDAKVSGINYDITLINTELVKDKIGPGPFERGWPIFIESDAHVKIKDSELRKVVITLRDEKAEFDNFSLETPTNFNYRNIQLENVRVMGQWGIFLHGASDVTIRDSEAFWTFIYDDSKLKLINTHMNEFDPRDFRGEIIFENSRWDTAAEIIKNNDFVLKGSVAIGNIGGFSWEDSEVTRFYDVIGKPNTELILTIGEETIWAGKTDQNGKASFSLEFNDSTFKNKFELKDNQNRKIEVTFFSATPLNLEANIISKFIAKLKGLPSPPPQIKFIVLISILVVAAIIIFSFWKKYFIIKRLTSYNSGLKDFLQFRFKPSIDLLVVLASYLVMVVGLYTVWKKVPMADVWIPVSMFVLGVLVPIAYNSLVKKQPLSDIGISKKQWVKSLALGLIISFLLISPRMADVIIPPFTELLPMLALEITLGLFYAIFFHGWIQMRFEHAFGAMPAILITTILFTFHHVAYGEPISLLYMGHFVGGLILAAIFRITRNILILWPFFISAAGLIYDLGLGLRLPFEATYGYTGVLILMWLFIAVVSWKQKKEKS
ncbi:MAG: hypothetical protein A2731_03795 [Candidatus Buchananbacteria bacterium RIFCSPHIGHO2_01_FULL_39_8]|uniref:CAAX prenyl protease 2/Lysostaphin resistance protein A-like domain-containing protein n=2 Tax=Candidatus Buchananiibacteriota TaxID=1817903 RepID=A0A1G1XTV0_9BACT|nr:MAG: hypothetical protein A2731_03795 [Candidatus Buchananbacteria bacterium RIFCSPHIGHO2_01_FULL_39_8]